MVCSNQYLITRRRICFEIIFNFASTHGTSFVVVVVFGTAKVWIPLKSITLSAIRLLSWRCDIVYSSLKRLLYKFISWRKNNIFRISEKQITFL